MNNYLEKIKIKIEIENLTRDDQQNPTLFVGLNDASIENTFELAGGHNTIEFSDVINSSGKQELVVQVKETDRAWSIGAFRITDVKLHGMSVGGSLIHCRYVPKYDDEFLEQNPGLPENMEMVLHVGNRGRWSWPFEAPIQNNKALNIGLW